MAKYTLTDYQQNEKMNIEEIIDNLLYLKRGYIPMYNFSGNEIDLERYKLHMALSNAVDLLRELESKEN